MFHAKSEMRLTSRILGVSPVQICLRYYNEWWIFEIYTHLYIIALRNIFLRIIRNNARSERFIIFCVYQYWVSMCCPSNFRHLRVIKLTSGFNDHENFTLRTRDNLARFFPRIFHAISVFFFRTVAAAATADRTRRCFASCQHRNETTGDRLTTAPIRGSFYRNFGEYIRPSRHERRLRKGIVFRPKAINDIWVQWVDGGREESDPRGLKANETVATYRSVKIDSHGHLFIQSLVEYIVSAILFDILCSFPST